MSKSPGQGLKKFYAAPIGSAWYCPDCSFVTVRTSDAANHALDKNHHDPILRPWTEELGPKSRGGGVK